MLCFSTRLRPTRSESIVTRHFLGILRLESEFKGNIGGIPSHSITWLQDVAKGCSLGMQPTFFGSLWWSQVVHPKGTYVITLCMPRVSSVWEWTHWRVGEVSLRTQPDFYLEFSWPVHVQVLWFARSPNSMRSGTSFSGHYWECIEDQCVSICKTLDSFSTLYCHQLWDWLNRNAGSIFERVWESLEDIYVSLPEWLCVLLFHKALKPALPRKNIKIPWDYLKARKKSNGGLSYVRGWSLILSFVVIMTAWDCWLRGLAA